jgi:hypothetical protein
MKTNKLVLDQLVVHFQNSFPILKHFHGIVLLGISSLDSFLGMATIVVQIGQVGASQVL